MHHCGLAQWQFEGWWDRKTDRFGILFCHQVRSDCNPEWHGRNINHHEAKWELHHKQRDFLSLHCGVCGSHARPAREHFPHSFSPVPPSIPPSVKAGLSRALRYLCSAAQERDESSVRARIDTLLRFLRAGGRRRVFSHLLVLRCRAESGPGRSASGCWDCWPALPPSLRSKGNTEKELKEENNRETNKSYKYKHWMQSGAGVLIPYIVVTCVIFTI